MPHVGSSRTQCEMPLFDICVISVVILQQPMDFLTIVLAALVALLALALFLTLGPFRLVRTRKSSCSDTFRMGAEEESSRHQGRAYTSDTQIRTACNAAERDDVQHAFMLKGAKTVHLDQQCQHLRRSDKEVIALTMCKPCEKKKEKRS